MSSPSSAGGNASSGAPAAIREGTRVILREITANLQNSPPGQSPRRKSGNEATTIKGEQQQQQQQHDVKVRFIREFADVGASPREATTESSLSSASSFQSLASTLSSKCSSGICVDSSPAKAASDTSYLSADIPGLDDLISACENIRLTDETLDRSKDQSFCLQLDGEDVSGDQTFTSAVDRDSPNHTREISAGNSPDVTRDLSVSSSAAVDGDQETSTANAYFECATVDTVEATRYLQTHSGLDATDEAFVQCVSSLGQRIDSARDDLRAPEDREARENLELLGESKKSLGNSALSLDEFAGKSISTLESLADLIVEGAATRVKDEEESGPLALDVSVEKKEIGIVGSGGSKGAEEPAQSVLDVTVDFPGDSKEREVVAAGRSEGIEEPTQSSLDVTVDFPSDSKEREVVAAGRSEGAEEPPQSVLDVTVDFPGDSKEREVVAAVRSEGAEEQAQSVLDVTVDFPSNSKDFDVVASGQSEGTEEPAQSVLDVTVDFPSDSKDSEIVGPAEIQVAKEPASSILDVTVELPNEVREIESAGSTRIQVVEEPAPSVLDVTFDPQVEPTEIEAAGSRHSEVAENPVESQLDVTVDLPTVDPREIVAEKSLHDVTADFPSNLKEIDDLQLSDFIRKEPTHVESPADLAVNVPSGDTHEFNEESQCPSLPTLSSVCLRADAVESDAQPLKEPIADYSLPTLVAPSLSEKFANIAAIDTSPGNSISTIKEPTFLNAEKFAEDSIELVEAAPAAAAKSEASKISETSNPDVEFAANVESFAQPSQAEFCEFKKPETPVVRAATKVSPPKSPKGESKVEETVGGVEPTRRIVPEILENHEADSSADSQDLDETVAIQDISAGNIFAAAENDQYADFLAPKRSAAPTSPRKFDSVAVAGSLSGDNSVTKPVSLLPVDEYADFAPTKQSTTLAGLERQPTPFVVARPPPVEATFNGERNENHNPALPVDDRCNFEKLEIAAKAVANDIYNTSLELEDESGGRFVSATSEVFYDPGSFDFLLSKTPRKNAHRDLRAESLYVKFDPLVSNTSMLPHGNIQNASPPANEERNGDNSTTIASIGTPKRSSAIAAIDKLLFYSPMTTAPPPASNAANIQKTNDSQEKAEPTEETSAETVNMAKELELVRSTVLQLEEQLEKLKIDHEEALEKQSSYQEKINQLQTQLAQEIKNKNQITVVVDEYEKSISRLVAERERDRKNLDLEKAKLQEELAAAKHHLDNTEAAFNDVHLKYERLKAVVSTYRNNEAMLKQSIQENVEIIKSLENRYEQVKEHATARLEKANQDLDAIRKQNESETVKLHAMLRKAELKSNSLAELVEQKTKENKELTQILDEVIARVGRKQSE